MLLKTGSASAAAGACTPPTTDYGKVTNIPIDVTATGNYRIWVRIQTSATSDNFLLQLDSSDCFNVGGSGTAAAGAGNWQWVDFGTTGTKNEKNFTSIGQHTLTMYGTGEGLLVDRVIFTLINPGGTISCIKPDNFVDPADGTVGGNCASAVNVAPTVSITASPPGGTAPLTTTVTANPTDIDGTITSVELFNGSTSLGVKNSAWTWTVSGLAAGTYSLTAKAIDNGGAVTTSSPISVTVTGAASVIGDCTGDSLANIDDLTKMGTNWNKSGASYSDCNFSPDTTVNIDDLTILANNWRP